MKHATAEEVRVLLRKRYAAPEWALLEEVRNHTGFVKQERYADAVAMNLYPSRGLEVLGFEIKVHRSDWLNELRDPSKSAPIQKFCDKWWIVAGGSNTVKVEELPPTWGLMVMGLNRFAIVKDAPKLEAQPLDRGFVASVLRREHNARVSEQAQDAAYQRGKADGITESKARDFHDKRNLELAHEQLSRTVKRFEEKTGLRVNGYDGEHLGDLITLARDLRGQRLNVVDALERAAHPLRMTLKLIDSMKIVADLTSNPDAPGLPMLP